MNKNKLQNQNIVIVTHVFATGPAQELEEYLKDKTKKLIFIGHPFSYARDIRSFYRIWQKGRLVKEKKALSLKLPDILIYLKDVLLTLRWVFFSPDKFDLYVGSDNLNTFTGLILKKLGKVKKVVFYTIDYVPQRFENKILNRIYHWIDRICVKNCDQTWNLSPRMIEGRRKRGIPSGNQIVVPIGANYSQIKRLPFGKINKYHLAFMGHLTEKQGVQLIISALPKIAKKIPDAKLVIIGTGPYEENLKKLTSELEVRNRVEFTGYLEDHRQVENKLASCALAIAMYNPEMDTFTYYADPGKLKNYLSAGLPVILTDVPCFAQEIAKNKCGVIIKYDKIQLANQVIEFLSNQKKLKLYRQNALRLAKKFDWSKVFPQALNRVL